PARLIVPLRIGQPPADRTWLTVKRAPAREAGSFRPVGLPPGSSPIAARRKIGTRRPGTRGRWDRIPDAHRGVARSRGQPIAVGAEGDGVDVGLVSAQLADLFPGGDVPQADGVVTAGRRQTGALPTERQAVDRAPVSQDRQLLVGVGVPEAYIAALR